jgi:hypothetical protein
MTTENLLDLPTGYSDKISPFIRFCLLFVKPKIETNKDLLDDIDNDAMFSSPVLCCITETKYKLFFGKRYAISTNHYFEGRMRHVGKTYKIIEL